MKPHAGTAHGFVGARDMSGSDRSASAVPTSHVTEQALFHAYRAGSRRVQACACGEDIEAADDWRAIADAVDLHNATTVHQQWRAWRDELR